MPLVRQARVWLALCAEILLIVALKRYDDWRYESMPIRFVETALLAGVALLLRLVGGASRYSAAVWYAWNPLVAYSFAGAAHFDSLMIAPMLAAILLFVGSNEAPNEQRKQWLLAVAGAAALGVAIS